jgi:Methylase involved in ubiquinone/menaquinone biosynthesis
MPRVDRNGGVGIPGVLPWNALRIFRVMIEAHPRSEEAMDPKERAEDFFSRYAPAYTESVSHRSGEDLQRLIAMLQPQGHGRLLDVATGPGHTAFALAPYVEAVVGLDLTPAMAREFRRQADPFPRSFFVIGDAEALPFRDEVFEWVTCRRGAHHFPNLPRALAEMARVLAPNGRLGLVDMIAPSDPAAARFLNELERIRDPSHMQALSREEWQARIKAAGLQVRALEVVEELLPWERWWAPVPPDGPAAARARAFAASGGPEAAEILLRRSDGWIIRKQRMILIASHAPAHPSCKERSESLRKGARAGAQPGDHPHL